MSKTRLQLTWYNKDKALIPTETGQYGYTWVEPSDPRYCETHTLVVDEFVQGKQAPKANEFTYSERADLPPQDDNLLVLGESGDVLEALARVPELAAEDAFANQAWGYLIAYEDDIAKSDSWDDLKTLAQPVSNTL